MPSASTYQSFIQIKLNSTVDLLDGDPSTRGNYSDVTYARSYFAGKKRNTYNARCKLCGCVIGAESTRESPIKAYTGFKNHLPGCRLRLGRAAGGTGGGTGGGAAATASSLVPRSVTLPSSQPVAQSSSQPVAPSSSQPVAPSSSQPVAPSSSQPVAQSSSQPLHPLQQQLRSVFAFVPSSQQQQQGPMAGPVLQPATNMPPGPMLTQSKLPNLPRRSAPSILTSSPAATSSSGHKRAASHQAISLLDDSDGSDDEQDTTRARVRARSRSDASGKEESEELKLLRLENLQLKAQVAVVDADFTLLVPRPAHWDAFTSPDNVLISPLPLPEGCGKYYLDSLSPQHRGWANEMMFNGASFLDAMDAVQLFPNVYADALAHICKIHADDGASSSLGGASGNGDPGFARKKRNADICLEVEEVITRFVAESGVPRIEIVGIERVQNHRLLTKYKIRHSGDQLAFSLNELLRIGAVNEHKMWHGTSFDNILNICHDGFDTRCSNRSGLLGEGNYFANSSRYSVDYCRQVTRAVPAPSAGTSATPPVTHTHTWLGSRAMMLCGVMLGRIYQSGLVQFVRKPPADYDSVGSSAIVVGSGPTSIYAVYDNSQCIPEYIVHLV